MSGCDPAAVGERATVTSFLRVIYCNVLPPPNEMVCRGKSNGARADYGYLSHRPFPRSGLVAILRVHWIEVALAGGSKFTRWRPGGRRWLTRM